MPFWKPHKLSNEPHDSLVLKLGQRVRAKVDLDGVPASTTGTVVLANGFQWKRYRVMFDNGGELNFLDERHIEAKR